MRLALKEGTSHPRQIVAVTAMVQNDIHGG